MSTMLERIEWVLAHRHDQATPGAKWNAAQWSKKAGLTKAQVSTFRDRLKKDPDSQLETKTMVALADAAGVSLKWLSKGDGAPDDGPPQPTVEDIRLPAFVYRLMDDLHCKPSDIPDVVRTRGKDALNWSEAQWAEHIRYTLRIKNLEKAKLSDKPAETDEEVDQEKDAGLTRRRAALAAKRATEKASQHTKE